jgi:hypothetical protein
MSKQIDVGSIGKIARLSSNFPAGRAQHPDMILGAMAHIRSNNQADTSSPSSSQSPRRSIGNPVEEVYALRDMRGIRQARGTSDLEGQQTRQHKPFITGLEEEEEDGEVWNPTEKAYD